jgi:hypothetical protein
MQPLHKAGELSPPIKEAIESLLGRALQEDESVSIRTFRAKNAPAGPARDEAYRRLLGRIDKTADRVKNVPEAELDAAIDEAADFVRHNPE